MRVKLLAFWVTWLTWLSQSEDVYCDMFTSLTQMRHLAERGDQMKHIIDRYIKLGKYMQITPITHTTEAMEVHFFAQQLISVRWHRITVCFHRNRV